MNACSLDNLSRFSAAAQPFRRGNVDAIMSSRQAPYDDAGSCLRGLCGRCLEGRAKARLYLLKRRASCFKEISSFLSLCVLPRAQALDYVAVGFFNENWNLFQEVSCLLKGVKTALGAGGEKGVSWGRCGRLMPFTPPCPLVPAVCHDICQHFVD